MSANRSCTEGMQKAERHVVRCAMGIVNVEGWAFHPGGGVIRVTAMRRLEVAIARLKEARKEAKKRSRK